MLLYADGRREGSISGGCLEADVAERARKTLISGEPAYVLYDTSGADGDVFFETGCNGAVGILIEPVTGTSAAHCLRQIAEWRRERKSGVIATVYRASGDCGAAIGSRLLLHESGAMETDIADTNLSAALLAAAKSVLNAPKAGNQIVALANGAVEVLIESLLPPIQLLICGAGQDAIPLAQCAAALGWQPVIADHREAFLTAERFPEPARQILTRPENLAQSFLPDARTVAVIMTHHAGHDRDYLRLLLPSAAAYIGLLGPKRRGERLLNELQDAGYCAEPAQSARLHSPAGLDIGAETPEEIALALTAEIQAVLNRRAGGALRERGGPIHAPSETASNFADEPQSKENGERFSCPLSG